MYANVCNVSKHICMYAQEIVASVHCMHENNASAKANYACRNCMRPHTVYVLTMNMVTMQCVKIM